MSMSTSQEEASLSRLAAETPSGVYQSTRPLRRPSTRTRRQQEEQRASASRPELFRRLGVAFSGDIPCPLFQKSGTQNRMRYIDISKLRQSLGSSSADALLGMHAFTVSEFVGRGKVGALKRMKSQEDSWSSVVHGLCLMSCSRSCRQPPVRHMCHQPTLQR
ncbi:unnamed protein product [Leuciscus chuanchicus]